MLAKAVLQDKVVVLTEKLVQLEAELQVVDCPGHCKFIGGVCRRIFIRIILSVFKIFFQELFLCKDFLELELGFFLVGI